jgi:hypothetical protein
MENIEQPPVKSAKRPWITVSGVMALAIVLIYFAICRVPLMGIQQAADSMGRWFLIWVPVVASILLLLFVGIRIVYGKRRDRLVWRVVKYSIIAFGGAGLIVAGLKIVTWSLTPPLTCSKAIFYGDVGQIVTVTAPKELQKLASFFPNLGQKRKSWLTGGWQAERQIDFVGSDGRTVTVWISWNDEYWSEGPGDWPLDPEFRKYIASLQDTPQTRPD